MINLGRAQNFEKRDAIKDDQHLQTVGSSWYIDRGQGGRE